MLEYSNVQKYFGDNLDPISVLENPINRPWWILRTKGSIHRLGFRSFTKNGALMGGSIGQTFVKEGYVFVAIRGGDAYLALAHQEDIVDCLGVNTEVQFDSANWVPFFGSEYRNGGFQIFGSGLAFKNGTQVRKVESQQVYEFDGTVWTKTRDSP